MNGVKEILKFKQIAQDRHYQMVKFKVADEEVKAKEAADLAASEAQNHNSVS